MFRGRYRSNRERRYPHRPARPAQGPLQPWLLLLLLQKPSHGYELLERLSQGEKLPDADPGFLYRTLRQLEEDGMVHSAWDTEGQGPARRLYRVTPEGSEYLRAWATSIRSTQQQLVHFLAEYEKYLGTEEGR